MSDQAPIERAVPSLRPYGVAAFTPQQVQAENEAALPDDPYDESDPDYGGWDRDGEGSE